MLIMLYFSKEKEMLTCLTVSKIFQKFNLIIITLLRIKKKRGYTTKYLTENSHKRNCKGIVYILKFMG